MARHFTPQTDSIRTDAFVDKGLGARCGKGWVGIKGACRRGKKGRDATGAAVNKAGGRRLTAYEKEKAQKFADKTRAGKALGKLPSFAADWEKEYAAESSSVSATNADRQERLKQTSRREKAKSRKAKDAESSKSLEGDYDGFSISKAKYADGKVAVRTSDGKSGFKGKSAWVAEFYGGKASSRDGAYIMPPSSAKKMVETMSYATKEDYEIPYKHYVPFRVQVSRTNQKEALADSRSKEFHRIAIESALKDSKAVPAEVLADYPDLKAKFKTDSIRTDAYINKGLGQSKCGRGWVGIRGNCRRSTVRKGGKGGLKTNQKAKSIAMADKIRGELGKSTLSRQKLLGNHFLKPGNERQSGQLARNTTPANKAKGTNPKLTAGRTSRTERTRRKEEQSAIVMMGGRDRMIDERMERGTEVEAIAKGAKNASVRRGVLDRDRGEGAKQIGTKGAQYMQSPTTNQAMKRHEGVKAIAEALDLNGGEIDTGDHGSGNGYTGFTGSIRMGKVKVLRLNPKSKKNPWGTVTIEKNGDKLNVPLPQFADGVRQNMSAADWQRLGQADTSSRSKSSGLSMFARKSDQTAARSNGGRGRSIE